MAKIGEILQGVAVETPDTGFFSSEPVPPGRYLAVFEKPQEGKGEKVQTVMDAHGCQQITILTVSQILKIVAGPHAGRKVYNNLGLIHTSEKYQESSRLKLRAMLRMCGVPLTADSDTDDLVGKQIGIVVKISESRTGPDGKVYGPKSELENIFPASEYQANAPQPQPQSQPPQPQRQPPPPPPARSAVTPGMKAAFAADEPSPSAASNGFGSDDDIPF